MNSIIVIAYLLLCSLLVARLSFFKTSGITWQVCVALFLLKIMIGFVYAAFYSLPSYKAESDTWRYFLLSKEETKWLLKQPVAFFKDLFTYGYSSGSGSLFGAEDSYWNNLKTNFFVKLLAICNVLTATNYNANMVIFNFLFFLGPMALYKTIYLSTNTKTWLWIFPVFLEPSFLFWSSGLNKDGLLFSALSLSVYAFYKQFYLRKIIVEYAILMLVCFLVLFSLRNYLLFFLLPFLMVWYVAEQYSFSKEKIFIGSLLLGIIVFFVSMYLPSPFNLAEYVVGKRNEFLMLNGSSRLEQPVLLANAFSFIYFFPFAIDAVFLQPYIFNVSNLFFALAAVENIGVLAIIIFAVVKFIKTKKSLSPFFLFCIFFSLSFLIVAIGYTIPFTGAIVRYKSVLYPFLLLPFCEWIFNKKGRSYIQKISI